MMVYVVGKYLAQTNKGVLWTIEGIYDNESNAVRACKTNKYFVGPIPMNTKLPEETCDWPNSYYPLAEKKAS